MAQGPAHHGAPVRVEVLGPLRVLVDGQPVEVPGPKRRALLAVLARAEGRVVSVDQLLDSIWSSDPPPSARAALHTHVSRLRGHLGAAAARLQATSGGYRLLVDEGTLDATVARGLLDRARQCAHDQPEVARKLLHDARALWRGEVLADLTGLPPIRAWAVALDELRREIGDLLVRCALDAGYIDEAIELAGEAAAADPLREPAAQALMEALAASGRAAAALRVAYDFRKRLRDEAGLDPSPGLGRLERKIAENAPHDESGPAPVDEPPPRSPSPLFGRAPEVAAIRRLVACEQVVTVVGPAGVGKTSLALEVVRGQLPATVLPLATVTEPADIAHALAATLDLRVSRGDVLNACATLLAADPHLLVIDNCEHLLEAARDTVSTLVATCPQLRVLATSRQPLQLPGESQCRIDPLPLPDLADADEIARAPSVRLFLDRARRVRPSFEPSPGELRVIGDIVRRLDGLPLAIELAAGRLSALGLTDLQARLDRALDFLGQPAHSGDAPTSTLRTTIDWSYRLLEEHERLLFRHLAVFPDGADLPTVEHLATSLDLPGDPAATLARLVDASMIHAELDERPRYRLLETMRAFGLDQLDAHGELDAANARLVGWAVDLATWIAATAVTPREPDADAALRREFGNLRAAWQLARRLEDIDAAVALVTRLAELSAWRDLAEIWAWAQDLVDDPAVHRHPELPDVAGAAAATAWLRGDAERSKHLAAWGLQTSAGTQHRWRSLSALSVIELLAGNTTASTDHALQAAACTPFPNDAYGIAALAAAYAGDTHQARTHNRRLEEVATYPTLEAFAAYVAGEIASIDQDTREAAGHYSRAMELARMSGASFVQGVATVGLVTAHTEAGRSDEALRGYRELLDYWERTGSWIQLWTTLRNLAALLRRLGDPEHALYLELAADRAPDALSLTDQPPDVSHLATDLPDATTSAIRERAASSSRQDVLHLARRAIARALAAGSSTLADDDSQPRPT